MTGFELSEFASVAQQRYRKLVWAIAKGESQLTEADMRDTLFVLGKPLTDLETDLEAARIRIALVGRLKALESECQLAAAADAELNQAIAEREAFLKEYEPRWRALNQAVDDKRNATRQFANVGTAADEVRRQLFQGASPEARQRLAELQAENGRAIEARNALQSAELSEVRRERLKAALAEAQKHKQEHTIDTAKRALAAFDEQLASAQRIAAEYEDRQRAVDDLLLGEMLTEECLALPSLEKQPSAPLSPRDANLAPYPDGEPELAGAVLQP